MIPIKLTMQAFGPFHAEQVLDFSECAKRGIFLITGKTGSGKTTIFDAISFALFGEPSGSVRRSNNLKSDFATANIQCFAELTFLSKNTPYTIRRTPQQEVAKRGGGTRSVTATAILTLEDGSVISGKSEVDQKIVEILGISRDQFQKIVLLPQGEFRSFLDADSKTRQDIFRSIFSTGIYGAFTDALSGRATLLKQETDALNLKCKGAVSGLTEPELVELVSKKEADFSLVLAFLNRRLEEQEAALTVVKNENTQLDKSLSDIDLPHAREINNKLSQMKTVQETIEKLTLQNGEIDCLKNTIQRLRRVSSLAVMQENAFTYQKSTEKYQAQLDIAQRDLPIKKQQYEDAATLWAKEPERQQQLEQYREALLECKRLQGALTDYYALLEQKKLEEEKCEDWRGKLQKLQLYLERSEILTAISQVKEQLSRFSNYHLYTTEEQKHNTIWLEKMQQLRNCMDAFLDGQAGVLAKQLADGSPCPVCGSKDHPTPAHSPKETPSQAEVEAAQEKVERALEKFKGVKAEKDAIFLLLKGDSLLNETAEEILQAEQALKDRFADQSAKLKNLEAALSGKTGTAFLADAKYADPTFLTKKLREMEQELTASCTRLENTLDRINEQRATLPENPPDMESLNAKASVIEKEGIHLKALCKTASEQYQQAATAFSRAEESVASLQKTIAEERRRTETAEQDFRSARTEAGYLDLDSFEQDKSLLKNLEQMERQVSTHQNDTLTANTLLTQLKTDVGNEKPYPLEELEEQFRALSEAKKQATQRQMELHTALTVNQNAADFLRTSLTRLQTLDADYRLYGSLAKLASGSNHLNLSFERFVMAGFFDEIIENANLRLETLSGKRYTIHRKLEKGDGRKASGLDLEVLDLHTGRYRDCNTLSGGESFITALALALAVADVIASYSGGVEINTMFIDEGFGSLDSDSLEVAIESLISLKNKNRLIGIISHVAALGAHIPTRLAVTTTPSGSSARFEDA